MAAVKCVRRARAAILALAATSATLIFLTGANIVSFPKNKHTTQPAIDNVSGFQTGPHAQNAHSQHKSKNRFQTHRTELTVHHQLELRDRL